ncbi:MAG: hypothetical protein K0R54_1756 [Clostridiaceae bacterium]|jgi:Gpi18-like mannosyltransferase|nr:hypothetical protein [Clostridiaceae bacterium]
MEFFKKNTFKICMIFIMLLSGILCIYTIHNYNGSGNTYENNINQRHSFNNENNQASTNTGGTQVKPPASNNQPPNANNHMQDQWRNGSMRNQNGNMQTTSSNTGYASLLVAYALIFLGVSIAAYFLFGKNKIKINASNEKLLVASLLVVGLLLRISLSTVIQGYPGDINLFKNWASSAANNFTQFYLAAKSSDYPPLYIYVLFLVGKIASIGIMSKYYILLLKLPSIIADIITAYLIYRLAKKHLSYEISIILSAFYIFNPAVFINSALWGQVDSFFTMIIFLAVYLLSENKTSLSAAVFTLGILMKPQGIIYAPIIFFELVRQRKLKSFAKAALYAIITALIIIVPFSQNKNILWIFKLYSSTVSEYPYASMNAFNFFSLIGANFVKYTNTLFIFNYHTWGMIFIVLTTVFSWFIYIKGNNNIYAAAAALIQIAGVFTFSVGMHERYLFPAAALSILTFIYLKDKRFLLLAVGFSTGIFINTHAILLYGLRGGMNSVTYGPVLIGASLLNVLLFAYLVKVMLNVVFKKKVNIIDKQLP